MFDQRTGELTQAEQLLQQRAVRSCGSRTRRKRSYDSSGSRFGRQ